MAEDHRTPDPNTCDHGVPLHEECDRCWHDHRVRVDSRTSNERNLPNLLREAERRVNAFVFKQAFPDFARIPADRDHDLDLLLCEAANEIERLTRERDDARAALGCMTRAAIDVERRSDETTECCHFRAFGALPCEKPKGHDGDHTFRLPEETSEVRVAHTIGELSDLMLPGFEALPFADHGWHNLSVRIKRNEDGSLGVHTMTFVPESFQSPLKASAEPARLYQRKCIRCGKTGPSATPEGVGVYYCSIECAD